MATKKSTVVPASPQVRPAAPAPCTPISRKAALEEVFEWDFSHKKNLETVLRSVAYLLDWSSETGNEPVDGFVAQGLHRLLRKAADDLSSLYTQGEALAAGADFQKLWHIQRAEVAVPLDGEMLPKTAGRTTRGA